VFQRLLALTFSILVVIAEGSAQSSAPVIKVSLEHVGNPQFPTGFWLSNSDPHFGHRSDALFWLGSDKVATTFFKEYCCRSGRNSGARYAAAIFDLNRKTIATHEWTSTPDARFYVGGTVGAVWVRHKDRVDVLSSDFGVVGEIPLPEKSQLICSKSGHGVAVQAGPTILFYDLANLSAVIRTTVPADTWAADVYGGTILLHSQTKRCYTSILRGNDEQSWNINSGTENASGKCASGLGLLSFNATLVSGRSPDTRDIVHRDGTVETIAAQGGLLGIADSGRLMFESFYPNPLAKKLDLDFGGHKEISIYDPSSKATVFRKKFGGQSGAALSPDGHHLAVIDGHQLLIYTVP
jgi:hypothetical protein